VGLQVKALYKTKKFWEYARPQENAQYQFSVQWHRLKSIEHPVAKFAALFIPMEGVDVAIDLNTWF